MADLSTETIEPIESINRCTTRDRNKKDNEEWAYDSQLLGDAVQEFELSFGKGPVRRFQWVIPSLAAGYLVALLDSGRAYCAQICTQSYNYRQQYELRRTFEYRIAENCPHAPPIHEYANQNRQ